MRNFILFLLFGFSLAGCGGSSGGGVAGAGNGSSNTPPPPVPSAVVTGTAFDGLILNGQVSVYDFSAGSKGNLLASTMTDNNGLYSLTLQVESRPLLIEITGGAYQEEAGPAGSQVTLQSTQKLTALVNYKTGTALNIAVTTPTHIAAGLAAYEIKNGTGVAAAIDDANNQVSTMLGIPITNTIPKEITDVANASASLTPELKYGFVAGAISMWVVNHTPSGSLLQNPFTSINLAQTMYADVAADGVLDGMGLDNAGQPLQLTFGTTLLNVDVYRNGFGGSLLQMASNANNKSGITSAMTLPYVQQYSATTGAIFKNAAVKALPAPTVSIASQANNAWVARTITVSVQVNDDSGLVSNELFIDNVSVQKIIGNNFTPSFNLDTTKFTTGQHTVSVKSINNASLSTTTNLILNFDNTPPNITVDYSTLPAVSSYPTTITTTENVCANDVGLGAVTITANTGAIGDWTQSVYAICGRIPVTVTYISLGVYTVGPLNYIVKDALNNCTTVTYSGSNHSPTTTAGVCP